MPTTGNTAAQKTGAIVRRLTRSRHQNRRIFWRKPANAAFYESQEMSGQKQAAPAEELRRQFMDHSTPLTEAGHWARRHIEQLEADRENLLQLLESASKVIGRFVSDEGWAQSDMDMMDTIDAKIASIRRAAQ